MRLMNLILLSTVVGMTACSPVARPFQPTIETDPSGSMDLVREENRSLPLLPSAAIGRITDALMSMNYRISASDSANYLLSFEQTVPIRDSNALGTATKQGTIRITPDGSTVKAHLVLAGHFDYYGLGGNNFTRLSAQDHKEFFDKLVVSLK